MKCVVTGAAGFIGSHLCEELVRRGHDVWGLDSFIPYYARELKERNVVALRSSKAFHFHELDLRRDSLAPVLSDAEVIFHLAAMPGLVKSWSDFDLYTTCNVQATQRLLEGVVAARVQRRRRVAFVGDHLRGAIRRADQQPGGHLLQQQSPVPAAARPARPAGGAQGSATWFAP